ncbi:response regulator [Massilia sp. CCM 8694]|uniref:Response regulator n=1 Tax=Massilia genomosp. 1 TaxID=2609280 RepID=A0ABX0MF74_9BURK|nr:response regulator [Massilia genomosp. 1]
MAARPPARADVALRVMVVDDNVAAATLAELLTLIGHVVDVANDGPTALHMAARRHPQLMFLDIGMPCMDGCQLAQARRQDARHAGVLLVALTGWGSADDRARTRAAGFDVHPTKPVEPGYQSRVTSNFPMRGQHSRVSSLRAAQRKPSVSGVGAPLTGCGKKLVHTRCARLPRSAPACTRYRCSRLSLR